MRFGVISLAMAAGLALAFFVAGGSVAGTNPDTDGDGMFNLIDNCSELANPAPCDSVVNPSCTNPTDRQTDTDRDGFGNRCDADYNNNGLVNTQDFTFFIGCFERDLFADPDATTGPGIRCDQMDFNDNLLINTQDFTIRCLADALAGTGDEATLTLNSCTAGTFTFGPAFAITPTEAPPSAADSAARLPAAPLPTTTTSKR